MLMRLRTLKPRVFLHRGLFDAEEKSGLPIRLFFMGLWCAADREGRFEWTEDLKAAIIPYDDAEALPCLDLLAKGGFVESYWHKGKRYGLIPSFLDHQVINNRESASRLPDPKLADGARLRRNAVDQETLTLPGLEESVARGEKPRKPEVPFNERPWTSQAITHYTNLLGGVPPAGKIGKFLKPLVQKYGQDAVLDAWQRYLNNKDPEFINPADFASHYILWTPEGFKAPAGAPAKRGTPPTFQYAPTTKPPAEQD